MGPTLLSAWLTCFIVSFDEIALAIFLVGGDPTFPVFLYGQLRFAQRLPGADRDGRAADDRDGLTLRSLFGASADARPLEH